MTYPTKWYSNAMQGAPELTNVAGTLLTLLDNVLINGFGTLALDQITVTSEVATATKSTGHAYKPWSVITIAGASPSGLNGDKRVLSTTGTTFTFAAPGVADGTAGGAITASIPPLGWSKALSGTNKAAYTSLDPARTGGLLRVDDSGTTSGRVRGFMAMSNIDTGTDPFPTTAQVADPGAYIPKSSTSTPRNWFLIGDGRFFVWSGQYDGSAWRAGCFGDLLDDKVDGDPWACVLCAAGGVSAPSYLAYHTDNTNPTIYIPRSQGGVAGALKCHQRGAIFNDYSSYNANHAYPSPLFGDIIVTRPIWVTENTSKMFRGRMPGEATIGNNTRCTGDPFDPGDIIQVDGFADRMLLIPETSWSNGPDAIPFSIEAWR